MISFFFNSCSISRLWLHILWFLVYNSFFKSALTQFSRFQNKNQLRIINIKELRLTHKNIKLFGYSRQKIYEKVVDNKILSIPPCLFFPSFSHSNSFTSAKNTYTLLPLLEFAKHKISSLANFMLFVLNADQPAHVWPIKNLITSLVEQIDKVVTLLLFHFLLFTMRRQRWRWRLCGHVAVNHDVLCPCYFQYTIFHNFLFTFVICLWAKRRTRKYKNCK